MRFVQAVLGISQYLVPGLLALGFGEIKRQGEPVRILALLWESGQQRAIQRASASQS